MIIGEEPTAWIVARRTKDNYHSYDDLALELNTILVSSGAESIKVTSETVRRWHGVAEGNPPATRERPASTATDVPPVTFSNGDDW
ncbi:MAG TPA: hypothetical protein VF516_43965 [Kofleriaceae bacterium]